MQTLKLLTATLLFGVWFFCQSASASGVVIAARVAYPEPIVTVPPTHHWQSETRCLRQAVRVGGKTCLKLPIGNLRAGDWALVAKGDVKEILGSWRALAEWKSRCESRPRVEDAQSSMFWRFDAVSRDCVWIHIDNRPPGEPWM